jgi:hypothetical protein
MTLRQLVAACAVGALLAIVAYLRRPQDARARYPLRPDVAPGLDRMERGTDDWATDPYTVTIWRTQ